MVELSIIILLLCVIFLAGIIHGFTGFAFGLISTPIMLIFISPRLVVPIFTIYCLIINGIMFFRSRKHVDIKKIWPLLLAGALGMPFGTYLLLVLDVSLLKVMIGLVITSFAIALFAGVRVKINHEKLTSIPVGFFSGLINTSTTAGGPLIVLFLTNQDKKKAEFRANTVTFFFVLNIVTLIAFMISGLMVKEVINYTVIFLPAVFFGLLMGMNLVRKVEEDTFKHIVLEIVIIAGVLAAGSGFGVL